eukprot:COSAG01_NODE_16847_length_1199_cov_2.586364_1_plen_134_part_00
MDMARRLLRSGSGASASSRTDTGGGEGVSYEAPDYWADFRDFEPADGGGDALCVLLFWVLALLMVCTALIVLRSPTYPAFEERSSGTYVGLRAGQRTRAGAHRPAQQQQRHLCLGRAVRCGPSGWQRGRGACV